jgi:hypothetical protein
MVAGNQFGCAGLGQRKAHKPFFDHLFRRRFSLCFCGKRNADVEHPRVFAKNLNPIRRFLDGKTVRAV